MKKIVIPLKRFMFTALVGLLFFPILASVVRLLEKSLKRIVLYLLYARQESKKAARQMKDEGILERVGDDGPEHKKRRARRSCSDGRLDGCSTRLVTGDVDHMLPLPLAHGSRDVAPTTGRIIAPGVDTPWGGRVFLRSPTADCLWTR